MCLRCGDLVSGLRHEELRRKCSSLLGRHLSLHHQNTSWPGNGIPFLGACVREALPLPEGGQEGVVDSLEAAQLRESGVAGEGMLGEEAAPVVGRDAE